MPDPDEGVSADGAIRTGAHRDRIPAAFQPVLNDAVGLLGDCGASLYVYGSVANGTARLGVSDVDLLSIGLPDPASAGHHLSARYAAICRGVEVEPATAADFASDTDAAYGYRVFLRHYCVHLTGPDLSAGLPAFAADARAARGFNGDLGQYLWRWRQAMASGVAADLLYSWAEKERRPARTEVEHALDDAGIVSAIVEGFSNLIGLWPDDSERQFSS